jgi:hypothetical protein
MNLKKQNNQHRRGDIIIKIDIKNITPSGFGSSFIHFAIIMTSLRDFDFLETKQPTSKR